MPDTLERLAYEISLRALERQETLLEELRSRTGTLLAASSVSASFLGARALDASGFRWLGLIALSLFGASVVSAIIILLPSHRVVFSLRGSMIFAPEISGVGIAETQRRLAHWIETFLDRNDPTIVRSLILFRISACAALAAIIIWSIQIAS